MFSKKRKDTKKDRQVAMSEYTMEFETSDDKLHRHFWRAVPLRYLCTALRPHGDRGVNYMQDNIYYFVPWHQIKKSSFKENVLWDDGY